MQNEAILVDITFRKFESDSTYGLITRLIYMKYIKMDIFAWVHYRIIGVLSTHRY